MRRDSSIDFEQLADATLKMSLEYMVGRASGGATLSEVRSPAGPSVTDTCTSHVAIDEVTSLGRWWIKWANGRNSFI